jgi:hypothetical protein
VLSKFGLSWSCAFASLIHNPWTPSRAFLVHFFCQKFGEDEIGISTSGMQVPSNSAGCRHWLLGFSCVETKHCTLVHFIWSSGEEAGLFRVLGV